MTEEQFYKLLHEQGQLRADDINADRRIDVEAGHLEPFDTSFECYVRELVPFGLVGLIYMGELRWAFVVGGDGFTLEEEPSLTDTVLALTPYGDELNW